MARDGFVTEKVTTLYEAIGGDPVVRALTHRFYELMDTLPEARNVRAVHPPSLTGSEEKFYEYMSGYLGGPPLYTDKRGHPRLRSRHFVAEIGPVERDEWLLCFRRALDETIASRSLRDLIWAPVERLAYHMQNRAPDNKEQP
jgi:hemoglobin